MVGGGLGCWLTYPHLGGWMWAHQPARKPCRLVRLSSWAGPKLPPRLHIPRTLLWTAVFLTLSPQPLTRSRSLADLTGTPLSVLIDVNLDFCLFF